MPRLLPTLLLLCSLPLSVLADDTATPVCGVTTLDTTFAPAEGRKLSRTEARDLARMFRMLDGEWRGSMNETVCMLGGAHRRHQFDATFKLQGSSNTLRLAGSYTRPGSGTTRLFARRLLIAGGELRVDDPGKAGEVELLQANRGGLRYAQRYRTVHELPQAASGAQAGDGSDATGDDGQDAVAGSDNLVSGEQTQTQDPPPERRSQTREERVSLQVGGRSLVLIQDYYTQGVYAGTMRWELRRR